MPGILPNRVRLFSLQHNGQFLFVSNDSEGGDLVVEAHPVPDEARNYWRPQLDPNNPNAFRLKLEDHNLFMFVSNDDDAGDNIVEAHQADEFRNTFIVDEVGEANTPFGPGKLCTFFSPQYRRFLFLSNTKRGNDYVIEAHVPDELRNQFVVLDETT